MDSITKPVQAHFAFDVDDLSEWLHTDGLQLLLDRSKSVSESAIYLNLDSENELARDQASKAVSDLCRLTSTICVINLVRSQIDLIESQTE